MEEFDFNLFETTDEVTGDDDFDFDLIFGDDEPDFDKSILDQPVTDYGDDDAEGDPSGGVIALTGGPKTDRGGGAALKPQKKERKLELVGA